MKHLSLYVIATVNTNTPIARQPRRAKKNFLRVPAWLRPFKAERLESREALT
jgi:hypothetical protein